MQRGGSKMPTSSQPSYEYCGQDAGGTVCRAGSGKKGTYSQRTTSDTSDSVGEPYEDLYLLQEIAFDLPEIENSLLSAISSVKHRNSFALPVWFVDVVMATLHFLLIGVFVFLLGLVAGFFMTSPIGWSGSLLWRSQPESPTHDLYRLYVTEVNGANRMISVEGTLKLSHYVQNPTPFAASISSYVSVSYLPQSSKTTKALTCDQCLSAQQWTPSPPTDAADALKPSSLQTLFSTPPSGAPDEAAVSDNSVAECCSAKSPVESGNLVTLNNVDKIRDVRNTPLSRSFDSSAFNAFTSHLLLGNKLHVVADIESHLNEVSYLINIKKEIARSGQEAIIADRLLRDCKEGYVYLRLESTAQRFETMFFGGDMLPSRFFPVRVPCTVAKPAQTAEHVEAWRHQHERFVNQFNILLNMDTMSNRRCSLTPPETVTAPAEAGSAA